MSRRGFKTSVILLARVRTFIITFDVASTHNPVTTADYGLLVLIKFTKPAVHDILQIVLAFQCKLPWDECSIPRNHTYSKHSGRCWNMTDLLCGTESGYGYRSDFHKLQTLQYAFKNTKVYPLHLSGLTCTCSTMALHRRSTAWGSSGTTLTLHRILGAAFFHNRSMLGKWRSQKK